MPEFVGFGKREQDGREQGAATAIIDFPDARKKIFSCDPQTGGVVFRTEANPHKRAFTLTDLRAMQTAIGADAELSGFYKSVENLLLQHIESNAALARTEGERQVTNAGSALVRPYIPAP